MQLMGPQFMVDNQLFLRCYSGTIMVSRDGGRTWEVDHQTGVDPGEVPDAARSGDLI